MFMAKAGGINNTNSKGKCKLGNIYRASLKTKIYYCFLPEASKLFSLSYNFPAADNEIMCARAIIFGDN